MNKNKIIYWVIQLLVWGSFSGIIGITAVLQDEYTEKTFYQLIELFLLLIAASHSIRWVFIKKNWFNLKPVKLIPGTAILILILSVLILSVFTIINKISYNEQWESLLSFMVNVLLYSIFLGMWTIAYLVFHLTKKSRLQEINNLKLQRNQIKNELKTLRNQLNPHFLFNSLNNIRALIEIDPELAKSAITTLSNLLRNSLLLSKKTLIQLSNELELVDEYLKLEKIRYEDRLNYSVNITLDKNAIKQMYVPPFLIQGMVENAIKHGISKYYKKGEIIVSLRIEHYNFIMEVKNTGKYLKNENYGIGIENTKRRLNLLYGENAGFEIKNENDYVIAYIWISKNELNINK